MYLSCVQFKRKYLTLSSNKEKIAQPTSGQRNGVTPTFAHHFDSLKLLVVHQVDVMHTAIPKVEHIGVDVQSVVNVQVAVVQIVWKVATFNAEHLSIPNYPLAVCVFVTCFCQTTGFANDSKSIGIYFVPFYDVSQVGFWFQNVVNLSTFNVNFEMNSLESWWVFMAENLDGNRGILLVMVVA